MNDTQYIESMCREARKASRYIGSAMTAEKNDILRSIAGALRNNRARIIEENAKDLEEAEKNGISGAFYDRLKLDEGRIESMAASVEEIAELDDPVGRIEGSITRPSGIQVGRMRVPLGVVAVIFESRPNVTTDIAALCIKSGNSAILRGGREAIHSNSVLYDIIQEALKARDVPGAVVTLITRTDRQLVPVLLKQKEFIDVVIPRGGEGLIRMVAEESTIPVLKHDKGLCHLFVDASAPDEMARNIAVNGKVQRPGVCNALETLLVHRDYPYKKELLQALLDEGVELRGCDATQKVLPGAVKAATVEDWDTEYLELILSVKEVADIDEAMDHIAAHSSGHSEVIVTEDYRNSQRFLREVDSAALFVNASSRFHDGGEFGLGAEVGISTEKLHARGAMGVEGLTTLKYVVYGNGEVRG